MTRLVVIGSVIADQMMTVPALPERGGDVLAGPVAVQPGGAFNILAAAARLGLPTALAGRLGSGPLGSMLAAALRELGSDLLLSPAEGDSGTCIGFVEPDGERTFVTSPGVEQTLTDDDLGAIDWAEDDLLYVSGYDLLYPQTGPAVAALLVRYRPATLLLDPGPLVAEVPEAVLDRVLAATDVLSLNERELRILGEDDPGGRVRLLDRLPADAAVVARVGAEGAWLHRRGHAPELIPSLPVTVIDSTGAGDAHAGALLASLAGGLGLSEAVRRANAAGALAVTRAGSATGPTADELAAALRGR